MNVLVVGGAGYIGSATCRALLEAGHTVTVLDNLVKGHRDAVPVEAELVVGDTASPEDVDRAFSSRSIDVVMDFAAFIEAGESMSVPERYFRNNTANVLTLLEAMLAHDVGRFVFSSSAAVFGDPEGVPVDEDAALEPTNPYGESKLQVERMLSWFSVAHGLRFAALRYFNAAGATSPDCGEDHDPESHLLPLVLGVAQGKGSAIPIYGTDYPTSDGTCVRDYVHVADLASAHLLALDALAARESVRYNLGNGRGFSVREVIEVARRVTGRQIPAVERPRRPGDPAILVASSAAIHADLGWTPSRADLESIVADAWEWHRNHPQGFRD
ncbi:MAG TPA: UDP-glucose 4-epimerase GalE [Acidimicrobiales bacterium]|nr:UDP-glucose 4-epimerase GalE [Acidimicrobiales bacterium]